MATLAAGATDLDMAVSSDGKFLYTLNTGDGTAGIFQINQDGTVSGLKPSAGFNGIAAF